LRDLVRTVRQLKEMQYVLGSGDIRYAKFAPKALNAVLDLGAEQSGISAMSTTCNVNGVGGIETDVGPYRVHVYNSSGLFTAACTGICDVLLIGGGGAGGGLGGGGAGARRLLLNFS